MKKVQLGITEGDWEVNDGNIVTSPEQDICTTNVYLEAYMSKENERQEQMAIANAKLIADAGTTANKTGLLPSELLEQRDELLEALKLSVKLIDKVSDDYSEIAEKHANISQGDFKPIQDLIKSIEK